MTAAAAPLLPFWDDPEQAWDRVTLGVTTLPGNALVGGDVQRDVEVKKAKGADKATIKDNGYRPSNVTITWRLHTEEQWQEAQKFLPLIHPRVTGGARVPVSIVHPAPNMLGVNKIYVKSISFPTVTSSKEIEIRIDAVEWEDEPKTPKQGAGYDGKGGVGKGNTDDQGEWWEEGKWSEEELDEYAKDAQKAFESEQAWKEQQEEPNPYDEDVTDDLWDPDDFLSDDMQGNAEEQAEYDYEATT